MMLRILAGALLATAFAIAVPSQSYAQAPVAVWCYPGTVSSPGQLAPCTSDNPLPTSGGGGGGGDVNITAVGGNAVTTNVPVYDSAVETAIGNAAIPTGTAASPPTDLIAVATQPVTSGGLSNYFVQPTASDNHAVIKAGAGQVYFIHSFNNSATVNYLRLYDATTGFNGCNSATNIVGQWQIPANTNVGGIVVSFPGGLSFLTGISICITSGYAKNDTTNATATAMSVNVGYK